MHEPLLERIRALERSVRRWRLASFALALVVVSLLAIGGTFGLIFVLNFPDLDRLEMLEMEVARERDQAEANRQQAEQVRRELEQKLRKAEAELRAHRDVGP